MESKLNIHDSAAQESAAREFGWEHISTQKQLDGLSIWRRTMMMTPNIRRTLSIGLTAIALAGLTTVAYGVSQLAGGNQSVGYTRTAQATPAAAAEPRRAGHGSALTLNVQDPSGQALQLVYVEGTGWTYGAPKSRDYAGSSLFRKIAFWSTTPAPDTMDAVQSNEALTVFIDGPSGYTYVWTQDGGWKFVGTLTDRRS